MAKNPDLAEAAEEVAQENLADEAVADVDEEPKVMMIANEVPDLTQQDPVEYEFGVRKNKRPLLENELFAKFLSVAASVSSTHGS